MRESAGIDLWVCDFADPGDRADFVRLMAEFAAEPVSASPHLGPEHFERVAEHLARRAGVIALLAARDGADRAEGVLLAFEGYSSFAAAALFNVHDVHVTPAARGCGLGSALVEALAEVGREHGHAKITLEVAASNAGAIRLYRRLGFQGLGLQGLGLQGLAQAETSPAGTTLFATRAI